MIHNSKYNRKSTTPVRSRDGHSRSRSRSGAPKETQKKDRPRAGETELDGQGRGGGGRGEAGEDYRKYKGLLASGGGHHLRCGMLDISKKRLEKDENSMGSQFVEFETRYFARRGIAPRLQDIDSLNQSIRKFMRVVMRLLFFSGRQKMVFFRRWKMKTFGIRKEIYSHLMERTREDIKNYESNRLLFSYRIQSRLRRNVFEAFYKWRQMVKVGYPLVEQRKEKNVGGSFVYELIHRKNEHISRIHDYKTRGKGIGVEKPDLVATYKEKVGRRGSFENKGLPIRERYIDQVDFYKRFSIGFETLRKSFARNMRELFFVSRFLSFPYESRSHEVLQKRYGYTEKVPITQVIPGVLVVQIFTFGYKRCLLSAFKKLQGQVRLIAMSEKLRSITGDMSLYRQRARLELILKVYLRLSKRKIRKYMYKWILQTKISKIAKEAGRQEAFKRGDDDGDNKKRKTYLKMKKIVEEVAEECSKRTVKAVVNNIMGDPEELKKLIDREFKDCVEGLLDSV